MVVDTKGDDQEFQTLLDWRCSAMLRERFPRSFRQPVHPSSPPRRREPKQTQENGRMIPLRMDNHPECGGEFRYVEWKMIRRNEVVGLLTLDPILTCLKALSLSEYGDKVWYLKEWALKGLL